MAINCATPKRVFCAEWALRRHLAGLGAGQNHDDAQPLGRPRALGWSALADPSGPVP